jgi:hypothetical protein
MGISYLAKKGSQSCNRPIQNASFTLQIYKSSWAGNGKTTLTMDGAFGHRGFGIVHSSYREITMLEKYEHS